ncbi:glycosyltransferase family 2 protein [Agromyces sp. Marseille-Q5079]|uniref:glycosyltransferase family 2 protein n=1 Tax=Agromyces sp. Marseille-Q5079 TaxID=3439059 RepID=UPI003D9CA30A
MKVSVVIPTYCSGDELDRTIGSLDAQTLPQAEFEVIMIDDGSPDGTYDRLRGFASTRPNYRVSRIENSGWPSRPRNIGIGLADGEYVLFMDHDDEIAPETLAVAWELGSRNDADAVNLKESRTHLAGWALPIFDRNHDDAMTRTDQNPLGPLTPHKMYRREFLRRHGIAFPEGGRVVNEDLYFNIEVLEHARTISVLADRAAYHWVTTGSNNSIAYLSNPAEQISSVAQVLEFSAERLAAPSRSAIREMIAMTLLSGQVLPIYTLVWRSSDADRDEVLARCLDLIERFLTPGVYARLDFGRRAIVELLRAGRQDLFEALDAFDNGLHSVNSTSEVEWVGGRLHVATQTRWRGEDGAPPRLRRSGDRVFADLGHELEAVLPAGLLEMTDMATATDAVLAVRSRSAAASWLQPTETARAFDSSKWSEPGLRLDARASIDPASAVLGKPLDEDVWDLFVRATLVTGHQQRRCDTDELRSFALLDGRIALACRTGPGKLALDLTQRAAYRAEIVRRVQPGDASWEQAGQTHRLRARLPGVHSHGRTTIPVVAVVAARGTIARFLRTNRLPARRIRSALLNRLAPVPQASIRGEDGAAFLEFIGRPSLVPADLCIRSGDAIIATGIDATRRRSRKSTGRGGPLPTS